MITAEDGVMKLHVLSQQSRTLEWVAGKPEIIPADSGRKVVTIHTLVHTFGQREVAT